MTLTVGNAHFENAKKVVLRFGHRNFDFWLFHWDVHDTRWRDDPVLGAANIKHIWRRRLVKLEFAEKFLTPSAVAGFTHVFLWDGDGVLTDEFDPNRYMALVKRARLAISQPAYSALSAASHEPAFNKHSDLFPSACARDDRVILEDFVEVRHLAVCLVGLPTGWLTD